MDLSADVAELADALDLGSSARKGVGVQVSPSAPKKKGWFRKREIHAIPIPDISFYSIHCLDRLVGSVSYRRRFDSYPPRSRLHSVDHSFPSR
jgi:hypothetical protein